MRPVAKGSKPNQAHGPTVPVTANPTKTKPRAMRTMRSIPPTFVFMVMPFKLDDGVVDLQPISQ